MLTSLKLQTSWSNTSWPQRVTSWKVWYQTPSHRISTPGRRAALAASNNERRARWTQSRKRGTGRRRGLLSLTCGAVRLLWSQPVLKILVCCMFVLSVLNYKQIRACKLKSHGLRSCTLVFVTLILWVCASWQTNECNTLVHTLWYIYFQYQTANLAFWGFSL